MDGISIENFSHLVKGSVPALVVDVRPADAYAQAEGVIPGAIRRDPYAVAAWAPELELGRAIITYDAAGAEASPAVTCSLQSLGMRARYLDGGFQAWTAGGGAVAPKPGAPSLWVTRERPKIDRIACPWLIRRFIDPDAKFIYVKTGDVIRVANETGALPYDIPGVTLTHREGRCSFDAFIDDYGLANPALLQLANIVRGADTSRLDLAPQAAGLFAISLGLSANIQDDQEMLRYGLVVYDALYAWISSVQSETHNWPPAMPQEAS